MRPQHETRDGKIEGTAGEANASLAISPDGRRVVTGLDSGLWMSEFSAASRRQRISPNGSHAVWSPQGDQLAFADAAKLYVMPSAGGEPKVLFESAEDKVINDWSRDGRFLLYISHDPKTQWDLWVLPLADPARRRVVVQTASNETRGQFSPDTRWIAYSSEESGTRELYVQRDFLLRARCPVDSLYPVALGISRAGGATAGNSTIED